MDDNWNEKKTSPSRTSKYKQCLYGRHVNLSSDDWRVRGDAGGKDCEARILRDGLALL